MAEGAVVEDISDSTDDFFAKYPSKLFITSYQTKVARLLKCLESTYDFTTVDGTQEYDLPADFILARDVRWKDLYYLKEVTKRPPVAPKVESRPNRFFVRSDYLGMYPIPDVTGDDVKIWYRRHAAPYALRIRDLGIAAHTGITLEITDTQLEIVVSGGAGISTTETYIFGTGAGETATIGDLATSINTNADLADIVGCEKCSTQNGLLTPDNLEAVSTVSIFGQNRCWFIEPELPEEMQIDILFPALMHYFKMVDREIKLANSYMEQAQDAITLYARNYKERRKGSGNLVMAGEGDYNLGYGTPLGNGGTIIIP